MKRMLLAISALACVATATAVPARKPEPQLSAAEKQARFIRQTGGMIINWNAMKGNITIIDAQKRVPGTLVSEKVAEIARIFMCDFRYRAAENAPVSSNALQVRDNLGANVLICVVDDPGIPSLLMAPEDKWGFVNVSRLSGDRPPEQVLLNRLGKEIWRALGYLLTRDSFDEESVMNPVDGPAALDSLKYDSLMQEEVLRIKITLDALGVTPWDTATYRDACEEGWAPAPTNDVQRAIWEKVHSIPKKPIKIEFDPEKGK